MEGESSWGHHIHAYEQGKAHNQHPQKFEIMIANEGNGLRTISLTLVFQNQSEATEEEEDRHTIMSEVRKQMYWKQMVWMCEHLPQAIVIGSKELILVLLHNLTYEVAIVVKHDRQDGYASHR